METINENIRSFSQKEKNCLNLIASENMICESAKAGLTSSLYTRYCFDSDEVFFFPGRDDLLKIEEKCRALLASMLNAKYVNIKAISGLNCMTIIMGAIRKKCKCLITLHPHSGGHGVTSVLAQQFGLNVEFVNLNSSTMEIDYEEINSIISRYSPPNIVLYIDHMNVLFPIDLKEISMLYPDILIIYDVSHLLGLIIGNSFMNPLENGADLIVGSTHKSLPGPHKGFIATNHLLYHKQFKYYSEVYVSHEHIADSAMLALTLENNVDIFYHYAHRIIDNAKVFGEVLNRNGIKVLFPEKGYTQSHQVWVDVGDTKEEVFEVVRRLASYGIIVNSIVLPIVGKWGIRIGVNEISQKMSKNDICELAKYFAHICRTCLNENESKGLFDLIRRYHQRKSILR